MKNMKKKSAILGLIFVSFILQSCYSSNSQTIETQNSNYTPLIPETTPKPDMKIKVSSNGKAEFKGVSFTYNSQIFGEVKAEEVAEFLLDYETDKGDFVEPAHCYFEFDLSTELNNMYLAVYPIEDFPRMWAVSKEREEDMKKSIQDLKQVLIDKDFRVNGKIPYLKSYDASNPFYEKVKHFSFPNGQGILFLTQYGIGYEIVSNHNLTYIFQGLTADKKYYVLAEMPVGVDFLSNEQTDEFEGYKIPWGKLQDEREIKKFDEFNQKIGKRLNNLPSDKYKPNLKYFEEMISSLKIEK
jgi:hypothetical protein